MGAFQPARLHATGSRAFTLVEVLVASVILAVVVAALTQAVLAGQMHTHDALHQARAASLAEATVERALRLNEQALDDFDGFTQQPGDIADATGEPWPAPYQTFRRSAIVQPHTLHVPAFGPADGRRLTVTVQDEAGRTWQLERFIADERR